MVTLRPISAGKSVSKPSKIIRAGLAPAKIGGNILTAGLEKITGRKYGRQTTTGLAQTTFGKTLGAATVTTAAAAAIAASPAIVASAGVRQAAATVGKEVLTAAIPKSIGGAAARIAGAGLVVSGAAPIIVKTVFQAGKTAGEVITGEKSLSAETIMDVGKGLGLVAGVGALGTAAGFVGKKILERDKEAPPFETLEGSPIAKNDLAPISPMTAETTTISEGAQKTRRKSRPEPRRQTISQSVRVNVVGVSKSYGDRSVKYLNTIAV